MQIKRQSEEREAPTSPKTFKDYYPEFRDLVMDALQQKYPLLPAEAFSWISALTDYCVPGGKLNRGQAVMEAVESILSVGVLTGELEGNGDIQVILAGGVEGSGDNPVTLDEKQGTKGNAQATLDASSMRRMAACLGWCIEWLQAYFLVADDVMDDSLTRRGQPCRHRLAGVGMIAVNDALLLRSSVDLLMESGLAERGESESALLEVVRELFREVERDTQMGQLLDLTLDWREAGRGQERSTLPIMHKYTQMVHYKTAIYTFYLPFACAYLLAREFLLIHEDRLLLAKAREISLLLGSLFQAQDNVLDVFGDPGVTGKIGTDIEEGKCTWLLCRLLEKTAKGTAGEAESVWTRLEAHYGRKGRSNAVVVEELYRQQGLERDFGEWEAAVTRDISGQIAQLPSAWAQRVFTTFLHKIVKRIK